jgi:hypothetical protein
MMRRWLVLGGMVGVLGVLSSAAIVGCSSTADPYPDPNTFCAAKATAECNSGSTGGIAAACNVAVTDCVNARQQACVSYANTAAQNGRAFSANNAPACIAAVEMAYASPIVDYTMLQTVSAACEQGAFPGTIAAMGTCKTSAECASSADDAGALVCSPVNPGSSVLECATPIDVAAGGQCGNFGSVCAAGTYCLGSKTTPYECQNGAPVGGTCTPSKGCAVGGYCLMNGGQTEGTCAETSSQAGAACSSDVSCGGGGPLGSTPTSASPYCDFLVTPNQGQGPGACEQGQSFGPGNEDCKGFGSTGNTM